MDTPMNELIDELIEMSKSHKVQINEGFQIVRELIREKYLEKEKTTIVDFATYGKEFVDVISKEIGEKYYQAIFNQD